MTTKSETLTPNAQRAQIITDAERAGRECGSHGAANAAERTIARLARLEDTETGQAATEAFRAAYAKARLS